MDVLCKLLDVVSLVVARCSLDSVYFSFESTTDTCYRGEKRMRTLSSDAYWKQLIVLIYFLLTDHRHFQCTIFDTIL